MEVIVTAGHFATEADAIAEIESRGWPPIVLDMLAVEEDFHWHDFTTVAFVLEGTALLELEDGRVLEAGPGARAELPARVVHRDVLGSSYRGVLGFSVNPAEMTQPVNKPLTDLDEGAAS